MDPTSRRNLLLQIVLAETVALAIWLMLGDGDLGQLAAAVVAAPVFLALILATLAALFIPWFRGGVSGADIGDGGDIGDVGGLDGFDLG